jgi:hypothetical protein
MKYTVLWARVAEDRLADLWNKTPDKAAVSAASNAIDRELANDAHRKGQALNGWRFLTVAPLTVVFTVSPDDCRVEVLQVYRTSKP